MEDLPFDAIANEFNLTKTERQNLKLDSFIAKDWDNESTWERMLWVAVKRQPTRPQRPYWLFAAAIVRQSWGVQSATRRRAIVLGEAVADAATGMTEPAIRGVRERADAELPNEVITLPYTPDQARLRLATFCCWPYADPCCGLDRAFIIFEKKPGIDQAKCPGYLRDLIYNPYLPAPVFEDRWLYANHAAVLLLSQAILYDYRYDRLPELADALVKAGCTDDRILAHCRRKEPHVRGCWVVDGLLRPDRDPLQRLLRHAPVPGDRLAEYLLSDPKDVFSLYRG